MISDAQSRIVGGALGTILAWLLGTPPEVSAAIGVLCVALVDGAVKALNQWLALRVAKAGLEYVGDDGT